MRYKYLVVVPENRKPFGLMGTMRCESMIRSEVYYYYLLSLVLFESFAI